MTDLKKHPKDTPLTVLKQGTRVYYYDLDGHKRSGYYRIALHTPVFQFEDTTAPIVPDTKGLHDSFEVPVDRLALSPGNHVTLVSIQQPKEGKQVRALDVAKLIVELTGAGITEATTARAMDMFAKYQKDGKVVIDEVIIEQITEEEQKSWQESH